MKADEVIKKIMDLMEEYGNKTVVVKSHTELFSSDIFDIEYDQIADAIVIVES